MRQAGSESTVTLQQVFSRRLLLLLALFILASDLLIVGFYQVHNGRQNRQEMADTLRHMEVRFKNQQRLWQEDAVHVLNIIEWTDIAGLADPQRNIRLQAFFLAQAESQGFEGVTIIDERSGNLVFDHWVRTEKPAMKDLMAATDALWLDEMHSVLYSRVRYTLHSSRGNLLVTFFKAWDSRILSRLSFPGVTSFLLLGSMPLLSSAGRLALETAQPGSSGYVQYQIQGGQVHEDGIGLADIKTRDGHSLPLQLVVRKPVNNAFPVGEMLAWASGVALLFGGIIFFAMGLWLRRIGRRLDWISKATMSFHAGQADAYKPLLALAQGRTHDQISQIAQELSALMLGAQQRDEEQRAYLQTLDMLQDAVIEFSTEGRLMRATDAWKIMTGQDDLSQCGVTHCVHPEDGPEVLEQISALVHGQKQQVSIRFRIRRPDESNAQYWVEARFAPVVQDGRVACIRGVVRDITNTYLQEKQISHMALHDALTDLPNRVLLEDRMEMALGRATRGGHRVALGFIDLDHFKQVNDNFGHKVGDRLLKEVTQRLSTVLRSTDTLCRWGGDEFVVLCPDLASLEDAREITSKLTLLTRDNISIDGTEFPFSFSAGFAVFPDDASSSEMLLSQADRAMFYAKAQGRNNLQFFNAIALKEPGRQSFYIQSRLATAIHNGDIVAWLQPLISTKSGAVIGAEVLARWHEKEHGWIPPAVFIPMAESMGLIDILGKSVWQQALRAFPRLPLDHRLSVNLSKRQLFSGSIVQQFCDDIEKAHVKPGQIMLEVTEGIALSDVEYAHERLKQLDERGFGIAVDDFGVGYSSLSQLHEIPLDELKLDMSFVSRIHQKSGASMAAAIISIAKSLGLECVAEGVEDARTANLLTSMGVDILQGYFFAKPMPIDEYLNWLAARAIADSST